MTSCSVGLETINSTLKEFTPGQSRGKFKMESNVKLKKKGSGAIQVVGVWVKGRKAEVSIFDASGKQVTEIGPAGEYQLTAKTEYYGEDVRQKGQVEAEETMAYKEDVVISYKTADSESSMLKIDKVDTVDKVIGK